MRLPNGYGSVHKLSGNRRNPWRVRKFVSKDEFGKPKYINIGYFPNRTKALEALHEFNKNPYDIQNDKLTFEDIYNQMIVRQEIKLSESSIKNMTSLYKHTSLINQMNIKEIKTFHLQKVVDEAPVGLSMKKKLKVLINKVFDYAVKNDIVNKNYAKFIDILDNGSGEKREKTPFNFEEIEDIFKHNDFDYDVIKILLCTGYRINELLGLKIERVHLEEGYMNTGLKTKAGKDRIVPISRHIKPLIQKYYNPDNEYLFTNKKGKKYSYTTYKDRWDKIIPNHTPHDTRHTFISIMDNVQVNKVAAKRIFGHADSNVTESVYTHKNLNDLKEVMDLFDDYLASKCDI